MLTLGGGKSCTVKWLVALKVRTYYVLNRRRLGLMKRQLTARRRRFSDSAARVRSTSKQVRSLVPTSVSDGGSTRANQLSVGILLAP